MTTTTITRTYTSYDQAARIVEELEAANIPSRDITILSGAKQHEGLSPYSNTDAIEEKGNAEQTFDTTVTTGGVVGGVGLLASLGLITIPGLGFVAAAGWLAATLAGFTFGAASGAAIGAISEHLNKHGVDQETATRQANALSSGSTLVAVRCDSSQLSTIESIMGTSDEVLTSNGASSTRSVA